MANERVFGWRWWAVGAGGIGLAMVATYIALIIGVEDDGSLSEAVPWILAMAFPAIGAVASAAIADLRSARVVLVGSAVIFTILGIVSIFSIGFGFLVAGMLAGVGAARSFVPNSN